MDKNLLRHAAAAVYYRLRQQDADGTVANSPVRTLAATGAAAGLALYPNPAPAGTALALTGVPPRQPLLDALGREVLRAQMRLPAGLAPGVYLLPTKLSP